MSPIKTVVFKLEPAIASVPIDGNIMHDKREKSDKNEKVDSPKNHAPPPKEHVGGPYNEGKWTDEEHVKFLQGLIMYGKNWNKIQKYIITRTCPQTRSHAQKFFRKL
jgi:SHAQKYF class myb-like DNA-binding protein